ncbi:MAG: 2OG-Fe(II) oxygenase [Geminicoccaceae bacterium]
MPILPGDPAPWFTARSNNNPTFRFDTVAGRYVALCFTVDAQAAAARPVVQALAASPLFDDTRAALFIVTAAVANEASGALPLRLPGVRAFFDADRSVAGRFGLDLPASGTVTLVLSPRLQVLGIFREPDGSTAPGARVLDMLQRLPGPSALPEMLGHAPVLLVPHVLEPELCNVLIEGYEKHGGQASGFMREVDGRTVEVRDTGHKVRRDWEIEEQSLIDGLRARFVRRVVPTIRQAFQFEATRMERYLVACYDASEGGHFRAHRDNTTKGTAHRRFAASVNLNPDGHAGGDLRFPEFGQRTYRPPQGAALVFSCSLMHEATPVTKGRRYAFLPFLYDEAAKKIRDENQGFIGETSAG